MKLTYNPKRLPSDYPQSQATGFNGFSAKYLQNDSACVSQVYNALSGNLTYQDNFNAVVIENVSASHNQQVNILNPLPNKSTPFQIQVLPNNSPIQGYTWNYTPSTNQISLTIVYGLSEQWCFVRSTATQSIANATGGTVTFNSTPVELVGTNISVSASVLTFAVAGRYLCSYQMSWAANATGDRFAYMLKNGSSRYAQLSGYALGGGVAVNQSSSAVVTAVAGDTLLLFANQTSGGALNTTSTPFPYLQATQLSIAAGAISDTPTIIILGGG